MNLQHFESLGDALASLFGSNARVEKTRRVAGGDINDACELTLTDGTRLFMKSNAGKTETFFAAEAAGLSAIARTKTVGTPHLFCTGMDRKKPFLLMEFIERKSSIPAYWEVFAQDLAAMHRADTADFVRGGAYGFSSDNFIGSRDQRNTGYDSWPSFFRDCRLEPQFRSASRYFSTVEHKIIDKLLERVEEILVEPEHPSLLHGDLWSGNVMTGNDGKAWLIDPAAYVGSAEADLAMTELFGGFPRSFYEAYREAASLPDGYEDRRDLYNLYHLLNHLNLFGRSYLSSVKRVIAKYVSG